MVGVALPNSSARLDEALLREEIWRSLGSNLVRNACFLAERLCAQQLDGNDDEEEEDGNHTHRQGFDRIEENAYALAVAYHRSGQPARARDALTKKKKKRGGGVVGFASDKCRFLRAQCCMELSLMSEAEEELLGRGGGAAADMSDDGQPGAARVPNGAAGYYLLGRICRSSGRTKQAIEHLRKALDLNPLLWSAYEELCQLGADEEVEQVVNQNQNPYAKMPPQYEEEHGQPNNNNSSIARFDESQQEFVTPSLKDDGEGTSGGMATQGSVPLMSNVKAAFSERHSHVTPASLHFQTPDDNGAVTAGGGTDGGKDGSRNLFVTPQAPAPKAAHYQQAKGPRKINYEGKIRKVSGRLFGDPMQISPPRRDAHATTSTPIAGAGGHKSKPRQVAWPPQQPDLSTGGSNQSSRVPESAKVDSKAISKGLDESAGGDYCSTLHLFSQLALGLAANCKFRSHDALEIFRSLPHDQHNTAWVQCQLAKANFELVRYSDSCRHFEEARKLDKHRLEDLEIYSTVLWHMKKETELMYLAHEMMSIDRLAPQSWCVLGNCFSLQKEHENALQFFQRALQLDPQFTYAHTLCGHEYFANEDYANSLKCYRNAIRIDPQHYNAWYGIGQIYYKQEKYEMTEYHFRRALSINDNSSVLRCCLGKTLHKMGYVDESLQLLNEAIAKDPQNAIAQYERAVVFYSASHLMEALHELENLKEIAPREPNLFFLLGKICKRLGRLDQAMAHFCVALDLKPSSSDVGVIKSAIEKLKLPDDSEEVL